MGALGAQRRKGNVPGEKTRPKQEKDRPSCPVQNVGSPQPTVKRPIQQRLAAAQKQGGVRAPTSAFNHLIKVHRERGLHPTGIISLAIQNGISEI
ncbi:hypothetical protein KM043_009712 [Ampulex compressa]|nr:hypothetical protein KM043_009712 [Ampulex compressa]